MSACATTGSKSESGAVYGNTLGNIANHALVAQADEWVYYASFEDGQSLYKMRANGAEKQKLSDETECDYISVKDDWVYFTNSAGNLLRIGTDGAEQEILWDQDCGSVNIVDDWIYCLDHSYNSQLYKLRADGEERQALYDVRSFVVGGMIIYEDWIYYLEGNNLFRHKLNDTTIEKITEDQVFPPMIITSDWIYYTNMNDNGYPYKIRPDGTGRVRVQQDSSLYLNVAEDWLYYSNLNDNRYMYRVRTDGTGNERLNEEAISGANIAGEWVYYLVNRYDDTKADELWRMRLDGTDQQKVS